ncbi:hypothetical protein BpHYR1_041142 [Brachionus plicatilis]
MHCS